MRARFILLLSLITAAAYLPALRAGFVWDDYALVLRDPFIRSWRLIPDGWQQFLFVDARGSNFFRPLQRLTYTADYAIWEFNPLGYHLTNILLHGVAALALGWFATAFFRRHRASLSATGLRWPPDGMGFFVAVAWAIHPILTSAVTYVSGRADSLAACFCFLALRVALDVAASTGRDLWLRSTLCAALCLLAAFSKEMGLFSFLLCALLLRCERSGGRRFIVWITCAIVGVGLYAAARSAAGEAKPPTRPAIPLSQRPILMAAAAAEYAALVAFPAHLHMERGVRPVPDPARAGRSIYPPPPWWQTAAGAGIIALLAALAFAFRRRREIFFPLAAFALAFVPVSNVFALNATVAEHWMYQPLAFLLIAAAAWIARAVPAWPRAWRIGGGIALGCWLAALGVRTFVRQDDWRDYRTFIERTLAAGGDTSRMWINLGLQATVTEPVLADACFRRALILSPGSNHATIGLTTLALGRKDYTEVHRLLDSIKGDRALEPARLENLALVRRLEGSGNGEAEIQEARRLYPDNWQLMRRHAQLLVADGRSAEAVDELQRFTEAYPYRADAWMLLSDFARTARRFATAGFARARAFENDIHLERRVQRKESEAGRPPENADPKPTDPQGGSTRSELRPEGQSGESGQKNLHP